ncbi:DUF3515 domain-containing protein [Corynebacterium liangguodongii]|uniref:DUF3515 domain-containing protein n=1 Tax=Corynebacterium liangguodongii TaxID=2079535 RepID=A0A2S0WDR4_9CORY|nr:DUF3515 domain-containing protein [Corynebacterium liangguodongii]AWB83901.1 DUF3515 domain-containing protein [Corynebacterium liangguodongii]PWB99040.1 DUF3515 domain-containing protein [Corynebacterium liangguodongii]
MSQSNKLQASPIAKPFIAISLVLALALVVGVLAGAKVYFNRVALQPVSMPQLPSPQADSPECAQFIAAMPKRLAGLTRAELAEPAPAGAAAWQASTRERVTLRCGVDMPLQYTAYTPIEMVGGASWMRIDDPVPGSTLTTFYTTDRAPAVAVTVDRDAARIDPRAGVLADSLPAADPSPAPAPLSQLAAAPEADGEACRALIETLPARLAETYERIDVPERLTAAWQAPGKEPIVVRCGVAHPENYAPGAQLYQINSVPWFVDETLSAGGGSSTWFALGREAVVAAYLPGEEGNAVVTELTEAIEETVPERS